MEGPEPESIEFTDIGLERKDVEGEFDGIEFEARIGDGWMTEGKVLGTGRLDCTLLAALSLKTDGAIDQT